jgi:hypothetical protein
MLWGLNSLSPILALDKSSPYNCDTPAEEGESFGWLYSLTNKKEDSGQWTRGERNKIFTQQDIFEQSLRSARFLP